MTPSKPLTASEIAAPPDRQLDALVAEKVMGWKPKNGGGFHQFQPFYTREWTVAAWQPSTDPRAMMEVKARLIEMGMEVKTYHDSGGVSCKIYHGEWRHVSVKPHGREPRAVAEAALLAVMSGEGER